jgi:alanine racemase
MADLEGRRPTWAEISLASLTHNYRQIRAHLSTDVQLMAVVKANAYGHGAVECATALEAAGADWFAVALVEEGIALRRAGIRRPIFCLGGFWQGQAEAVIAHDLTPAVFRPDALEELNDRARAVGRTIDFHLKVDTGMGRLGISVAEVDEFAERAARLPHLRLDGLATHFADADAGEAEYTDRQIDQFIEAEAILAARGIMPTHRHLANSAGIHAHPRGWGNLARAGATLYGLMRDVLSPRCEPWPLRPVMSLHTRIVYLKEIAAGTSLGYGRTFIADRPSLIATLPIGYADGFRRSHSNNGQVIIRGYFAPIVGRISMDLILIDVTDVPGVGLGDEVVLLGERDGRCITAEDLAEAEGTISYEVVCGVSGRVPRIYLRDEP